MEERTNYRAAYDAVKIPEVPAEPNEEEKTVSVLGTVVGCTHLNVREKPSKNAPIVATIPKDTILTLDLEESTTSWYKVYTVAGVCGFCLKDFVNTK